MHIVCSKSQLNHNADLYNRTMPLKLFLFENINEIQFKLRIKLDKMDPVHVQLALESLEAELVKGRLFERRPHFKGFRVRCLCEYILYSTILLPTAV